MILSKSLGALAIVATLAAPAAFAQGMGPMHTGQPNTPMMGTMQGMGMGRGMGMMSAAAGHVEGRIAFLKAELKITDAQLPLWNAVADAMRANAKAMTDLSAGMTAAGQAAATLPDRLAARQKLLTARLDAASKLKAAVDPLYVALTDDQKKTADEITLGMPMGRGMGMMGAWRTP